MTTLKQAADRLNRLRDEVNACIAHCEADINAAAPGVATGIPMGDGYTLAYEELKKDGWCLTVHHQGSNPIPLKNCPAILRARALDYLEPLRIAITERCTEIGDKIEVKLHPIVAVEEHDA